MIRELSERNYLNYFDLRELNSISHLVMIISVLPGGVYLPTSEHGNPNGWMRRLLA
jgi:hypothetical protein